MGEIIDGWMIMTIKQCNNIVVKQLNESVLYMWKHGMCLIIILLCKLCFTFQIPPPSKPGKTPESSIWPLY